MSFIRLLSMGLFNLSVAYSPQLLAHAHPQQQSPAANAVISTPAEVRMTFSEPLEAAFSQITVLNAKGDSVTANKATVDGQSLVLVLPALTAGRYTVKWAVVASDGHRSKGNYSFSVK